MGLFDKFKHREHSEYRDTDIVAVCDGEMVSPKQIKDEAFSKEVMGQTIAFIPENGEIVAPANGILEALFPTLHAFTIRMNDGTGLLIHIGIDTIELQGKAMKSQHKQGDKVIAGDIIIKADLNAILESGKDPITMLIISEPVKEKKVEFIPFGNVKRGQKINR